MYKVGQSPSQLKRKEIKSNCRDTFNHSNIFVIKTQINKKITTVFSALNSRSFNLSFKKIYFIFRKQNNKKPSDETQIL